jgi:hypothetical protein
MAADQYHIFTPFPPDRFEQIAVNHAKWRSVASHLMGTAVLIWPAIERGFADFMDERTRSQGEEGLRHRGPFYVLAGLSIENLLKAVIIQARSARGEPIIAGKKLVGDLKTHDLVLLARRAGIEVSKVEEDLLVRLKQYVTWAGRYPIPLHESEVADNSSGTMDKLLIERVFSRADDAYMKRLGC